MRANITPSRTESSTFSTLGSSVTILLKLTISWSLSSLGSLWLVGNHHSDTTANIDLTVVAYRLPRAGESVSSGEFRVSYGGKGANQALAALKAGCSSTLQARIGRDPYGDLLHEHIVKSGLEPSGLLRDAELPAGVAIIVLDPEGNNQIVFAPGSNHCLTPRDVEASTHLWSDADLLLAQIEIPLETAIRALDLARSQQMTTILNPAPASPLTHEV